MATGMKQNVGPGFHPNDQPKSEETLRRDRITAMIVSVVMLALISLLIWLASMGGGNGYEGIDTWPMMP